MSHRALVRQTLRDIHETTGIMKSLWNRNQIHPAINGRQAILESALGLSMQPRAPDPFAAALTAVAVEAETCQQAQIPIVRRAIKWTGEYSGRTGYAHRQAELGSSRASAAAPSPTASHDGQLPSPSMRRPIKAGTRQRGLLVPSVASSVRTPSGSYDRITLTALMHHRLDGS
ncbi:hypothetical protein VTN00DRAFT_2184 [Thermoascus crustaceus]|uniref:uncharacterized protein n=1 Tax=Thermoascus crustaceus TaxID=5088 RepID=UPI0037430BA6